jgi:hypothetical protein
MFKVEHNPDNVPGASVKVTGKNGVSALVLAHSTQYHQKDIFSVEATYPRIVHAELLTHRMLSRCSSSSRAIPFAKMLEALQGMPVRFGKANPGMQDTGIDHDAPVYLNKFRMTPQEAWLHARDVVSQIALAFYAEGYHKQIYNRFLEPFQMIKTVITATEWNNFFWLRDDVAADPTLQELARCIKRAKELSVPMLLRHGEWHLPYVEVKMPALEDSVYYYIDDSDPLLPSQARQVSSARTAAVSFRNVEYGLTKSEEVFARLVGDERKHGSALEHQATPMQSYLISSYGTNNPQYPETWEDGISHMDKEGRLWSGNFCGWIQHRKLIPGENMPG